MQLEIVCKFTRYLHDIVGAVALRGAAFGQGTGLIIQEIYCYGYAEQTVTDCYIDEHGYGYCSDHRRDAGVRCCESHA